MSKKILDLSDGLQNKKIARAAGEIPYSALSPLADISNETIFSIVESGANFKLTAADLKRYLFSNRKIEKIWGASDGSILNLQAADLEGYQKIKIAMQSDIALPATEIYIINIPEAPDFFIDFEIDYSSAVSVPKFFYLKINLGASEAIQFLIDFSDQVKSLPKKVTFTLSGQKILNPKGPFAYFDGLTILAGGLLPNQIFLENDIYKFGVFFTDGDSYCVNDFICDFGGLDFFKFISAQVQSGVSIAYATPFLGLIRNSENSADIEVITSIAINNINNDVYSNYGYNEFAGISTSRQLAVTASAFDGFIYFAGQGI